MVRIEVLKPEFVAVFYRSNDGSDATGTDATPVTVPVPSTFMRKFICRLRLNEVSRQ